MRPAVSGTIQEDDIVVLWQAEGRRFLARAGPGVQRIGGLGVVNVESFLGRGWGHEVTVGDRTYRLLRPRLGDVLRMLERKAQVILPKDAARILLECGIGPGHRVAEAGVGSAGLTVVLAHAVGSQGRVLGFDVRGDHLRVARGNLERAGLADRVDLVEGDVTDNLEADGLDALVLDVPDPGRVLPAVADRLAVGATAACYTPLVSQMEAARRAMEDAGFGEVRSLETLEREWINRGTGSRPDTKMLGHTGFVTFGRRVRDGG